MITKLKTKLLFLYFRILFNKKDNIPSRQEVKWALKYYNKDNRLSKAMELYSVEGLTITEIRTFFALAGREYFTHERIRQFIFIGTVRGKKEYLQRKRV